MMENPLKFFCHNLSITPESWAAHHKFPVGGVPKRAVLEG